MSDLIAPIFDILSFGSIVVLVVLGLGVIVSMMGIFNFAHGEFVTIGAYTMYLVHSAGGSLWLGVVLAPVSAGLVGLIMERTVVHRLYDKVVAAMLATWAMGLMIRETIRILIGGLYLAVPEPVAGSFQVGDLSLSAWRLTVFGITIVVVLGSWLLLSRTTFGLQVRAALGNAELARSSGISTSFIYAATFTFGAALAGLAGALIVPIFSLFADLGLRFLVQGFVSILVGGLGSLTGPLVAAAGIGSLGSGLPWIISPVTADILIFVAAIIFAKFWPGGLSRGKAI